MIPRVAHFVFGLQEQTEPFHFLHYASLESCRQVLRPDAIYFHHKNLPWGPLWERVRRHLTLVEVGLVDEVLAADYSRGDVPGNLRYAHHSDFIRLDALLEHGGVYADIDTIFVRPFPDELFAQPFVIGREPALRDMRSGGARPSLCNALLMSAPGAPFARAWRERMGAALDGSWSNHSGFLPDQLSRLDPASVRVEPETTFYSFPATEAGLARLLEQRHPVPAGALSVHLWAHLWWERWRTDFSEVHAGRYVPAFVRRVRTTLADIVRPWLPDPPSPGSGKRRSRRWSYLAVDEDSGYGVAAARAIAALEDSGLGVTWTPFVPGARWGLGYQPVPTRAPDRAPVVVAHMVPEYLPLIRARRPDAFLVAHTVWDTDRIPDHWVGCLNEADLVVVPSRFSAAAIDGRGVSAPVAIVPHVAPPPLPAGGGATDAWADIPDDALVFYTVAEWNERKAVFRTVEAYLRAFSSRDNVVLVVKTSQRDRRAPASSARTAAGEGTSAWSLARLLAAHGEPAQIRLVTRVLTHKEMAALHRRGDCFVSLARAEGWGLGAFDAAAYGNPVVTTAFGGQLDYLAGSPHLVRFELIAVENPAGFPSYAPDQRWAEPDVEHAAALLREVADDPHRAAAMARPIAAQIMDRYRPAAVAAAFRAAVEAHDDMRGGRPAAASSGS